MLDHGEKGTSIQPELLNNVTKTVGQQGCLNMFIKNELYVS